MPALDQCHEQIVHALRKAGWIVDDQPYVMTHIAGRKLFIDIKAQRGQEEIIVVEVKCFADNELGELYVAIGQYMVYRSLLRQLQVNRTLYLAIPNNAYQGIFREIGMPLVAEAQIKLIVVDLENEVVEQWLG